jgi:hypothetical protein
MFGSCRFCQRPTDEWQDFCNDCATSPTSLGGTWTPLRVISGGKSEWERPEEKARTRRPWLRPVPPPTSSAG